MYTVYADDVLIHDSYSPDNAIHLISPTLKVADNSAGSFEMTVPKGNPGYDAIERFTTTIKVKKDNKTIWTGRVINESEDFWKRRKFTCEGALSYLNDSIQELAYYDNYTLKRFFTKLIDIHNDKVASNRQFIVGTISMTDAKEGYEYKTDYKNTLETITEVFSNRLGGHIRVRYGANSDTPIIDYLKDYPNTASQDINFGDNLLDFSKNWDLSNLATVILPRGKQLEEENEHGDREYTTIKSVNGNSKYLQNVDGVMAFGKIEKVVDFNDIDDPALLKRMGENYIAAQQFDDMVLNVSAVDLHHLNPEIVSFELLDQVRCYSAPHGLNKTFPITEINIPLDTPNNVQYTMGSTEPSTLTAATTSSAKAIMNTIDTSGYNLLAGAKHQATELINQKTTGYVNIITENETSQALIISDKPDLAEAKKLWRWNLNGLGYLNMEDPNNPDHDYSLAITSNGVIVADFIKTGSIDDGYGYNRWNLTTGEFQMAYNTEVANALGQTVEVVDIINLAQDGVDIATDAMHKQSGGTNLLNGTNKNLKVADNSEWAEGTWDGNMGASASKDIVDISGVPNSAIVKSFKIFLERDSETFVVQRNVEVAPNQVYVASCYMKGTCRTAIIGYSYGSSTPQDSRSDLGTEWKRYSFIFRTPESGNVINIYFGGSGDRGTQIFICGMKLERGNTASDWTESEWDTYGIATSASADYTDATADELKTYTKKYTDTISDADRAFTKSQREALDQSFTQYKVLQRLTNNFSAKGIYLSNNQLYMNADYVRTGTLDAGIVKAGILTDKQGNNKWNMTTGYLYTKNMEAVNMRASGRFECGDYYKMVNDGGEITGYRNRTTYVGSISPNASIWSIPKQRTEYGLSLRAAQNLDIRAPEISVRNRNDNGTSTICHSGTFKFSCVDRIQEYGNGGLQWWTTTHEIQIINGLIVAIA